MSKIFDLINELCPEGVEFRELGEIADIVRGQRVTKAELQNDGKYPVVSGGIKPLGFLNKFNREANTITVAQYGTAGYINFIEEKFWANDVCYCIFPKKEISNKFLLYCLMKNQEFIYSLRTNAIPAHLPQKLLSEIKLPVPPMEVQREIVRILDSFTLLTAELTARKKQYEFYRDFLLSFDEDQNEIKWDIIDNIFIMKNGYTPSKANKDFWENGTISWYRMEDIRENGRILSESIQKITPQAIKGGKLIPKNSIIVATTATIGEHALAIADSFLMNQRFTSFTIRELLKDKLDTKFVFYYFFKICEWCKQNTNSSSFPSVDMAKLKKVKFPIPSLQTQQKVVEILDKFDTLVNSITEGLPREIELRRKQYEHYRELLLNFKPKMRA
ncbi:restriction endonuclease subunit S [Campylobacter concisus]|uniref:restriction endonuclease subunit S n=1 Tax=Campylobacter concisus TaxID=199 RepID=UPI00122CDE0D|nr:restriction endonuclease subunit S [Campylobacter concisus]